MVGVVQNTDILLGKGGFIGTKTGSDDAADRQSLRSLDLDRIVPGKYQPRTRMDESSLAELAESIRAQGVVQPILVRSLDGGRFEIIAGERRWRAAQRAGLMQVPAVVRDVADQAALALSLIENIQREDLNPLEEAQGIARLQQGRRLLPHKRVVEQIQRLRFRGVSRELGQWQQNPKRVA